MMVLWRIPSSFINIILVILINRACMYIIFYVWLNKLYNNTLKICEELNIYNIHNISSIPCSMELYNCLFYLN